MKKYIIALAASAFIMPAFAQETYESAMVATEDLNGTARYVGMGGALDALGADISVIGSNPAGMGLFRKSNASMTFGFTSLPSQKINHLNATEDGKTVMSFDQIGLVYSSRFGAGNYVNFGFNYHKSRNFNQILAVANSLKNASQNKTAYIKGVRGSIANGGFFTSPEYDREGIPTYYGYESSASNSYVARSFSVNDYLLLNAVLADFNYEKGEYAIYCSDADEFGMLREQEGYIGEYDFNISGNHQDRIFWGVTVGVKDVHYSHTSTFGEHLMGADGYDRGYLTTYEDRTITGQGYDIAAGIIIRPVDESPFRVGLSVKTPTWYELTSGYNIHLVNDADMGLWDEGGPKAECYKYKVFTPWKFGVSIGHTVGSDVALGLSYDYADYSSIDNRYITDESYDYYYDSYSTNSASDRVMNSHTKKSLRGVSTLKAGMEVKITPEFSVRAGYNYVSPMYKNDAMKTTCLNSDGCYYSSSTDYTNWKATNRLTCGVGYSTKNFSLDLAYQYSNQKGDFYPFESMSHGSGANAVTNVVDATEINNERHQLLITLGVKL